MEGVWRGWELHWALQACSQLGVTQDCCCGCLCIRQQLRLTLFLFLRFPCRLWLLLLLLVGGCSGRSSGWATAIGGGLGVHHCLCRWWLDDCCRPMGWCRSSSSISTICWAGVQWRWYCCCWCGATAAADAAGLCGQLCAVGYRLLRHITCSREGVA